MKIVLTVPYVKRGFIGLPLGLCYISSTLQGRGYKDITGVDLTVDDEEIFDKAIVGADLLGITVMTKTLSESKRLARKAKEINPRIKVMVGGPHPTLAPQDLTGEEAIDFVVIGEGENTVLELVKNLEANDDLSRVNGIWFRKNGTLIQNPSREFSEYLDSMPFPDRTLFNPDRYKEYRLVKPLVPILATRSCPYKCTNCMPGLRMIMGNYRKRSPENVVAEMEEVIRGYGIKRFDFRDNDIIVDKKWFTKLCNKMIERKINAKWRCLTRASNLSEPILKLMKEAGCIYFSMGVESGSPEVLDNVLEKGINLQQVRDVLDISDRIKLPHHCWFMIGIPGETKEQMMETVRYSASLNANSVMYSVGNPLPYTGFERVVKEKGWTTAKEWDDYDNPGKISMLKTDKWGPEDVEEAKDEICRMFKERGWIGSRETLIFRNLPKEAKWQLYMVVAKEGLTFLKDFKLEHIKNIINGLRYKFGFIH